jgi:APA family basic amino acid/polyamine antiporter
VRDARRSVPLAVVGSISGAALLYALLQLAALGALPDLSSREQPLPDVAALALGSWGGSLLGVTALLSMLGFCAGVALVAPRYFMALAEDGYLPPVLASVSTRGTPALAIAASTTFAAALAVVLGYASLVDVSNVVILSGYALTCLAALVLRVRRPEAPRRYRPTILVPVLAFTAAVALLISARPGAAEWSFAALLLAVGFGCWVLTVLTRRILAPRP